MNSSVVDKDSLYNIQDFKITQFTDSTGTLRQFRGASGWYFQAAASTAQARINTTANDERDTTNRSSWGDIVAAWTGGTNVKPITNLFMGLTTFGGYYYGSRDSLTPGNYNCDSGPIRMTYLYGDANSYNDCRMKFQLQSACKARLTGTTQSIPNWASSGSLVPDSNAADISLVAGTDNFIVFDGMRAIRIRPLGWLAHMADHAMKPSDTFTSYIFPGGMQMVWRENHQAFAYDGSTPIGDYTEQYTVDSGGTITYNNKIEISAFHHKKFGDWCDTHLGGPDRYQLKARAKVWYRDSSGTLPAQPDPYKVLIGSSVTPADEVIEVTAQERKTVHTPPSTGVSADYAKNPGFIFTFSQTVDKIGFLHITFHYGNQLIGAQFWGKAWNTASPYYFPMAETYNNVITYSKPSSTDQVTDDFSASLISQPFGTYANSPLPQVFLAVTAVTGTRYRRVYYKVCWTIPKPSSGVTYDVAWGDGTTTTGITTDTFNNVYDGSVGDTYRAVLTVHTSSNTYTHGTTIKV